LLDEIIKIKPSVRDDNEKNIKFCIIGRTNVGKSTLLNAIVNKERSITSHLENTTRDLVDDIVYVNRQKYTIIDTAGIRKPGRVKNDIEKYAILRAKNAINKSQITLLVLDCSRDFTEQDEIIGGLAFSANIPTIICVNK
jgi:GTP-binding protein